MANSAWFAKERQKSIDWARELLDDDIVILDFETTGFGDAEIVQIGAIDGGGQVLMDTLVKPTGSIPSGAARVHGITDVMVQDAPGFPELYVSLSILLAGKRVVAYNAAFEKGIMNAVCKRHRLPSMRPRELTCAMIAYARYYGTWNEKRRSFKWQSLSNACFQQGVAVKNAHTAVADCVMTLELMKKMTKPPMSQPPV